MLSLSDCPLELEAKPMSPVYARDRPALWLTADMPLSENTMVGPALSVNGYRTSQITALYTTQDKVWNKSPCKVKHFDTNHYHCHGRNASCAVGDFA